MTPRVLVAAITAVTLHGCVLARQPESPLGRTVQVVPEQWRQRPLAGELMAVSAESLWVARDSEIVSASLVEVRRVRVQRADRLLGNAMAYGALVGFASGLALTSACGQAEGDGCAFVLPLVLLSAMGWGTLSVSPVVATVRFQRGAGDWEALRRYARFPQGLPEGFPRQGIRPTIDRRRPARQPRRG